MIYFDNAATTRVREELIPLIERYNNRLYYNPSAQYKGAIEAVRQINTARQKVARVLGAESNTITFTSSGTESNNQALFSAKKRKGSRIIMSALEHASVYAPLMELKQQGHDVVSCPVDSSGKVDIDAFCSLLSGDTSMVAIMHINNETGAINDIARLVQLTKQYNPNIHFHSDGVQALCKIPINVQALNVDSYSISGHKIGAPKGVAALYIKKGVHLKPLLYGGGQEKSMRSSTENVSGIIALGEAAELAYSSMGSLNCLSRDIFGHIKNRLECIPDVLYITSKDTSAPHILTFALPYVKGEVMLHSLEEKNIYIGTGSACGANKKTNRIKSALNLPDGYKDNIIRLSISENNTREEGIIVAEAILEAYNKLSMFLK